MGVPWWLGSQCRRHRFDPWSRKIPHALAHPSPCAMTIEPVFQHPGAATPEARGPQSPCPVTGEATAMRSLCRTMKSRLHSPQLEESPCGNEDAAQPKKSWMKQRRFSARLVEPSLNQVQWLLNQCSFWKIHSPPFAHSTLLRGLPDREKEVNGQSTPLKPEFLETLRMF